MIALPCANGVISMILIRDVTAKDIDDICEIEGLCFSTPWTAEGVKSETECENGIFLVAESDGRAVGYVSMRYVLDEGYINNVAVLPEYRRQGIGKKLLLALNEECEKRRLSFITLEVRESNEGAIGLYTSLGYEQVGRRKRFYRLPDEDALLLTKTL